MTRFNHTSGATRSGALAEPRGLPVSGAAHAASDDVHRRASAFFLAWLVLAAAMSLAGNVCHALLIAPAHTRGLAASAALVPPLVLLAATHSASWLVRARSTGGTYWVSIALTAALAAGSFALSFDALRSFAVMLGIRDSMAWIWPAVIDVAIAHATLCLLSLNRVGLAARRSPKDFGLNAVTASAEDAGAESHGVRVDSERRRCSGQVAQSPRSAHLQDDAETAGAETGRGARAQVVVPSAPKSPAAAEVLPPLPAGEAGAAPIEASTASDSGAPPVDRSEAGRTVVDWMPVAELLVRDGVTSKSAPLIAAILAENEAGTPPSTIGRRHEVHHTTVSRIVSAAEQFIRRSA